MSEISRRKALGISAAAIVVGPSVLVTRTASAAPKYADPMGFLKLGDFTVKLAGMNEVLSDVTSVDLGSINFTKGAAPTFGFLKIGLLSASDALKNQLGFAKVEAPAVTQKKQQLTWGPAQTVGTVQQKVQLTAKATDFKGLGIFDFAVALLSDAKKAALTYKASKCSPESLTTNAAGESLLSYKVGFMETVTHKPMKGLKVESNVDAAKIMIGDLGSVLTTQLTVMDAATMTKATLQFKHQKADGTIEKTAVKKVGALTWTMKVQEMRTGAAKTSVKKVDALTWSSKIQATVLVSGYTPPVAGQDKELSTALVAKKKYEFVIKGSDGSDTITVEDTKLASSGLPTGAATVQSGGFEKTNAQSGGFEKMQDFHFQGAELTSIGLPKLVTGSDAPVTQTLNFTVPAPKAGG